MDRLVRLLRLVWLRGVGHWCRARHMWMAVRKTGAQRGGNCWHLEPPVGLRACWFGKWCRMRRSRRRKVWSWTMASVPARVERANWWILLLRRLRLPIPLTASHCRCRRALDPYGDHRAACAQSGILRNRAGPLERATARMCREAGARVTTNTLLTDINIEHSTRPDAWFRFFFHPTSCATTRCPKPASFQRSIWTCNAEIRRYDTILGFW